MTNSDTILSQRKDLSKQASKQQRLAASPDKSVWVSASAGTGKTKVLSDRVLRLLLNNVIPSKILCLTYTKAAAVEMNSRIAKKLGEWSIINDKKLEEELISLYGELPSDAKELQQLKSKARRLFALLLDTPGGIKIQTIHSFCQEVLKRFPIEANVSPYFQILDERDSLEAINDIKNHILSEINFNPESDIGKAIAYLTANIAEHNFTKIIENIISNRGKIEQIINKQNGKKNLLKLLSQKLDIEDSLTFEQILKQFFEKLPIEELENLSSSGIENISDWLEKKYKEEDYENYLQIFLTKSYEIKSVSKKKIFTQNPTLTQIFINEAERCLALIEKIKSFNLYQSTKAVIVLSNELIERYNLFKQIHAKMDYNDMILLTKNLLENRESAKWVLYKLDGGIDNILIDEAQDTSPDQWAIIKSLCDDFFSGLGSSENSRTIFAVGDRKQSIYSFQGADPDKFDDMRQHFSSVATNFEKINLDVSFRSTSSVLDTVNHLFSDEQVKQGVASLGENIEHIPFRKGEAGKVEFWELIESQEKANENEWSLPTKRITETSTSSQMAKMIAEKIKLMVSSKEILKSKNRPLQYGDFLILVRSRDSFCEELIRECKALNINISGIDRINLMEQIAIQDLVSLGKFLLLPDDDLSLAEVLKSPLYNLDDDDLFNLCYKRSGSLWNSLLKDAKYQYIAEDLKELFNIADYVRPFELYNLVLSKNEGRKKYYERMGAEAEDGIDEFLNLCLSFEQNHIASLQNFINWISSDNIEIKREMEQSKKDMVRLMTVHGSKGLQAPIVILPDTTRVPKSNRDAGFLWDNDIFLYPTCSNNYNELCDKIKNKQKIKMLEEYRRLLYVAVTRAEDMMIFCGFCKKTKSPDNSWYNIFKNSFTQIADNNNKVWIYENPQEIAVEQKSSQEQNIIKTAVPNFMLTPATKEKPLSKPLTPSKPDEEPTSLSPLVTVYDSTFYKRGSIIHKLLQFIPETPKEQRQEIITKFIRNKAPEFSQNEQQKILSEVTNLIENKDFGMVFGSNSQAEVPVMGEVEGKIISGQIDRLIITDEKIIIVDYKTNRQVPANINEVPSVYISQLAAYKSLLKNIYPQKKIETYLLWTNNAYMMKI